MLSRVLRSVLRCRPRRCGARRARAAAAAARGPGAACSAASTVRKPAEVVGVPGAGQVGLAEADQAVAAEPGEELVGPVRPSSPGRPADAGAPSRSPSSSRRSPASRRTAAAEQPAGDRGRRRRRAARSGTASRSGPARPSMRAGGREWSCVRRLPGGGAVGAGPAGGAPTARCRGRGSGAMPRRAAAGGERARGGARRAGRARARSATR